MMNPTGFKPFVASAPGSSDPCNLITLLQAPLEALKVEEINAIVRGSQNLTDPGALGRLERIIKKLHAEYQNATDDGANEDRLKESLDKIWQIEKDMFEAATLDQVVVLWRWISVCVSRDDLISNFCRYFDIFSVAHVEALVHHLSDEELAILFTDSTRCGDGDFFSLYMAELNRQQKFGRILKKCLELGDEGYAAIVNTANDNDLQILLKDLAGEKDTSFLKGLFSYLGRRAWLLSPAERDHWLMVTKYIVCYGQIIQSVNGGKQLLPELIRIVIDEFNHQFSQCASQHRETIQLASSSLNCICQCLKLSLATKTLLLTALTNNRQVNLFDCTFVFSNPQFVWEPAEVELLMQKLPPAQFAVLYFVMINELKGACLIEIMNKSLSAHVEALKAMLTSDEIIQCFYKLSPAA